VAGEATRDALAAAHQQRIASVRVRALAVGAGVAITVVSLSAIALFLSDTLRVHGGAQPALAQRITATTGARSAAEACRSDLSPDAPLRLWIGGDSLAGSLGPSLGAQTASTGVVQPVYDSRVSSGLSSPEFFDWPRHAIDEMARLNPEVVVFIIGANDWTTPRSTPTDASGAPAWRAEYAQQVETVLEALEGADTRERPRPVYWVGSPPLQEKRKDAGVREVNAVAREVIAGHPTATYVDAYQLFSSPEGVYTASLAGPNGKAIRVRTNDGVHFTPEGGDVLGVAVYGPLDARCRLDAQSVVGAEKPVLQTKGSTQVPGTHRETATPSAPPPVVAPPPTTTPTTTPTTAPSAVPPSVAPSTPTTQSTTPTTASTLPTLGPG
jgi:hypothetical protein